MTLFFGKFPLMPGFSWRMNHYYLQLLLYHFIIEQYRLLKPNLSPIDDWGQ